MSHKLIGARLAFELADAMEMYLQDLTGKVTWPHPVVKLTKGVPVTVLPTIWGNISFERFVEVGDPDIAMLMNGTGPNRSYSSYVVLANPDTLKQEPSLREAWLELGKIRMEKSAKRGVYSVFPHYSIMSGVNGVLGYSAKPYLQMMDNLQLLLLPGAINDLKACVDPMRAGSPAFPIEIKDYMHKPNKVGALPITQVTVNHKGKESLLLRISIDHLKSEFFLCPLIPLRYEQAPDLSLLLRCILKYSTLEELLTKLMALDPETKDSFMSWINSAASSFSVVHDIIGHLPKEFLSKSLPMIEKVTKMKGLADKYGWSAAHLLARETQLLIDTSSTLTGLFYDPNNFIGPDNLLSRVKRTKYSLV